ncbi:MAG: hypothetical protein AAF497_13290, partial [Planctomycetota bacterium]
MKNFRHEYTPLIKGIDMNFSEYDYEDMGFSSETKFEKTKSSKKTSSTPQRAGFGRRRGKAPQQFNGIHRRRKK